MRPVSAQLDDATPRRKLSVASLRIALCLVAFLGTAPSTFAQTAQASQTLRVVPLVRDDHVLVSFELAGGLTDEVRDAIQSGLRTTFTYTVELRLDVPAWVDRTISTATVAASVTYDNLTRTHEVVRMLDGRVEAGYLDAKRGQGPGVADEPDPIPSLQHDAPRTQPRLLHPRERHGPAEQRFDLLAVRQRTVRAVKIHVHPLVSQAGHFLSSRTVSVRFPA